MRNFTYLPVLVILIIAMSCNQKQSATNNWNENNPFFGASKLPFQAADFTRIKNSDFKPAIEEGMKQQQAEVLKVAEGPGSPDFRKHTGCP